MQVLSLPVGMKHDRHSPALDGAIEVELANFGCALTGLHKTAGAPMILAECGWTPIGLHTCRAILIAWRRIAGSPSARHLRTWLLFLVGKLCRRITAWLRRESREARMNPFYPSNAVVCVAYPNTGNRAHVWWLSCTGNAARPAEIYCQIDDPPPGNGCSIWQYKLCSYFLRISHAHTW